MQLNLNSVFTCEPQQRSFYHEPHFSIQSLEQSVKTESIQTCLCVRCVRCCWMLCLEDKWSPLVSGEVLGKAECDKISTIVGGDSWPPSWFVRRLIIHSLHI